MRGISLILTGFMASGKTTLGKGLAQRLQVPFLDTDEEIQRRSGKTIPEIFSLWGEAHFRQLEVQLAHDIASYSHWIIATGGGFFCSPKVRQLLQHHVIVVLWASPRIIAQRLQSAERERPLAPFWKRLYRERQPLYQSFSHQLNTGEQSEEECLEFLECLWRQHVLLGDSGRSPCPSPPSSGSG